MTNSPPTISILIPVYNVAPYLDECLQSILSQVDKNAQIVIMNDASTDNCWEILQKYQNHPNISIINAPNNRGISATRNELLKLVKHDYIWFIDSDDIMHKGAYQAIITQLAKTPVDVMFCDYMNWQGDIKKYVIGFDGKSNQIKSNQIKSNQIKSNQIKSNQIKSNQIKSNQIKSNQIKSENSFLKNLVKTNNHYIWNKIYKKSLAKNIQFPVGKNFEDIYYMCDLSKYVKDFIYLKYPVIDYRQRDGSLSKMLNRRDIDDYLTALIYREHTLHESLDDIYQDKIAYYLWYKAFCSYISLLKQLIQQNDSENLSYTIQQYQATFLRYYEQAYPHMGLRKFRLRKQYKELLILTNRNI